jgi:sulfur-oxidizing protein SoxY
MPAKCLMLAACLAAAAAPALAAGNEDPDRLARWDELSALIFGDDARIAPTETAVTVSAPERAHDAALVPVTIATTAEADVTALALVVDENPGPVAAQVRFGPAGDPREFGLRVRVEGYSNVHAVATTADGALLANAAFVKGAGGCSAPIAMSDAEAMAGAGEMRMKFGSAGPEGAERATLMIRHPNFNGMQMNQVTMLYTPPRYVSEIEVTRGDALVFAMTSDLSLAADPVIDFLYEGASGAPFTVSVTDSEGGQWRQEFVPPEVTN